MNHDVNFSYYYERLVILLSSSSTVSTKAGKLASVRQSLMNDPSCSVGKLVDAYALPRLFPPH